MSEANARTWNGDRPSKRDDGWPTRRATEFWSAAEVAIRDAMLVVESTGASIALTNAVTLLEQAQSCVADHMEGVQHRPPARYGRVVAIDTAHLEQAYPGKTAAELMEELGFSWLNETSSSEGATTIVFGDCQYMPAQSFELLQFPAVVRSKAAS